MTHTVTLTPTINPNYTNRGHRNQSTRRQQAMRAKALCRLMKKIKFRIMQVCFFTGVITLAVLCLSFLIDITHTSWDELTWTTETVYVDYGDTLWGYSKQYCPEGIDCREWIDEVVKLNNFDSSGLMAGDCIEVWTIED